MWILDRMKFILNRAMIFMALFAFFPVYWEPPGGDPGNSRPLPAADLIDIEMSRAYSDESAPEKLLLPDLQTLPPYDLRLVVDRAAGRKFIRFSNAILNSGLGPLELLGRLEQGTNTIAVTQVIYAPDQSTLMRDVGHFYFHREHDHWHWDNFSLYEVWSIHPDGSLDSLLVSSGKVSYCVRDNDPLDAEQASLYWFHSDDISRNPRYVACGWSKQGLSAGWVDAYRSHLAGQSLNISNLQPGTYALKSTANPDNILLEASVANNSAVVYFVLEESRIHALEAHFPVEAPVAIREVLNPSRFE